MSQLFWHTSLRKTLRNIMNTTANQTTVPDHDDLRKQRELEAKLEESEKPRSRVVELLTELMEALAS